MILNGLPWKQTEHSVVFETAFKYCISDSFVGYDGYSIFSKGFLAAVARVQPPQDPGEPSGEMASVKRMISRER